MPLIMNKVHFAFAITAASAIILCWSTVEGFPRTEELEKVVHKDLQQSGQDFLAHILVKRYSQYYQNTRTTSGPYRRTTSGPYRRTTSGPYRRTTREPSRKPEDETCSSCSRCPTGKCRSTGACC
ncbi:hypothetical protein Ocin01_00534 [Orchesella cincta]|uniref:Uncharacterized protein n=1 Tax=Orchesella cincta TaxID=48709 RepID=A0A1D2NLH6_ORCCI|nr:hypothetical protein Ocin01_00534 [Orchesella cincta]